MKNPDTTPLDDDIPVMDICFFDTPTLRTTKALQAAQASSDGDDANDEQGLARAKVDQLFNESAVHQRLDLAKIKEDASAKQIATKLFIPEQSDDPCCAQFRVLATR